MGQRLMRWTIFAALAFTVPVLFFLLQIAVLLPLAALPLCAWQVSGGAAVGITILAAIHLLVYAPLLWAVACLATGAIQFIRQPAGRHVAHAALLGALVAVAVVAPYSVGGHGSTTKANWPGAFTKLCRS